MRSALPPRKPALKARPYAVVPAVALWASSNWKAATLASAAAIPNAADLRDCAECVQICPSNPPCHPGSRVSGYPGPTETAAQWVPALAPLGRDDNQFSILSGCTSL